MLSVGVFDIQAQQAEDRDRKEAEERELVISFAPSDIGFDLLHTYTSTEAQVYTAVYEGLVTYHPFTLEPVSGTARRWEVSDDGRTYRFFLRSDARYWNGDQVTAAHFRDTWLKLLDPEESAEYSFLLDVVKGAKDYRLGRTEDPSTVGIRVVSDTLLEVELVHPAGHFLKILCHHSFSPLHPDFLDLDDWDAAPSILSNGPFYLVERNPESLVLEKNNLYWDRRNVNIDRLTIEFIEDPVAATVRFNDGEIHWAGDNILYDQVKDQDNVVFNPLFSTHYFFFNCKDPALAEADVRRGLALLIPWEEIREGNFIPTEQLVPGISGYPEVSGISGIDVEEGLRLLAEAGFPGGEGLPDLIIAVPSGGESQRLAGIIESAWKEQLATEVSIESFRFPEYYVALKSESYTMGTITWIGDFADPLTFLQMWTSDSNLNDGGYNSPEFDEIVERSLGLSGKERYTLMSEAETLVLYEAAVIPVSHTPALNFVNNDLIEGWFPNPLDIHPFKYIDFSEPQIPEGVVMSR